MSVQPTTAAAANPYPNDYDDLPTSPTPPPIPPLLAADLSPFSFVPSLVLPPLVRSLLTPPAPESRGLKRTFDVVKEESYEDLYKRARLIYEQTTTKSKSARTPSPVPLPLSPQPTNPLLPDPVGFIRRDTEPTLDKDALAAREAKTASFDVRDSDLPLMLQFAEGNSVVDIYQITYEKGQPLGSGKYCDVFATQNDPKFVLVHLHKNAILENFLDLEKFWPNAQSNYETLLKAGVPLAQIQNIETLKDDLFAIREKVKPIKELDLILAADVNSPINQEIKNAAIRCYGIDPDLIIKAENMYFVETAEGPKLRLIFEL